MAVWLYPTTVVAIRDLISGSMYILTLGYSKQPQFYEFQMPSCKKFQQKSHFFIKKHFMKKLPSFIAVTFQCGCYLGYLKKTNKFIFSPLKHKKLDLQQFGFFFSSAPTAQNGPRMKIHIGNMCLKTHLFSNLCSIQPSNLSRPLFYHDQIWIKSG